MILTVRVRVLDCVRAIRRGVAATVVGAMLAFVALAPSSAQPVVTDRISTATVFWPLHLIGVAAGHTA